MGAQNISREMWDTIADSQPPKQLVKEQGQGHVTLPFLVWGLQERLKHTIMLLDCPCTASDFWDFL
jgi:hypothetical protein